MSTTTSKATDAAEASPHDLWDQARGIVRSRAGGWRPGKGVYCRGFDLLNDLAGKASYFQVVVLNATGRLPERRLADWLEASHICMSYPDSRIWCNQIGALAGAVRAPVLAATTAGALAADSRAYGVRPLLESIPFLQRALEQTKAGASAREIVAKAPAGRNGKPHIMGFARPIANGDERIPVLESFARSLGFTVGEHLALAYEIERVMLDEHGESMNLNAYAAAFLCDQGFTADEVCAIFAMLVASGVTACYVDAAARPAETFLPLRCDDIEYQGPAPRPLPERR
jgi:hypothetical protein